MAVTPRLSEFIDSPHPVPLIERLPWTRGTSADFFERVARPPHAFLLESARPGGRTGRYSYIGTEPFLIFKSTGTRIEIQRSTLRSVTDGNPMEILKRLFKEFAVPRPDGAPPFFGGAVGFLSYELVHLFENIPRPAANDLDCPDLQFLFVDTVMAFDHEEKSILLIHCPPADRFAREDRKSLYEAGLERIGALKSRMGESVSPHPPLSVPGKSSAPRLIRWSSGATDRRTESLGYSP